MNVRFLGAEPQTKNLFRAIRLSGTGQGRGDGRRRSLSLGVGAVFLGPGGGW
jgi:hypothetical protein